MPLSRPVRDAQMTLELLLEEEGVVELGEQAADERDVASAAGEHADGVEGRGLPVAALRALYGRVAGIEGKAPPIDVILLVRGGGAPEELATFSPRIDRRSNRL